jgi:uridylate kinase
MVKRASRVNLVCIKEAFGENVPDRVQSAINVKAVAPKVDVGKALKVKAHGSG